jgi:hypothetical protein
VHATANRLQRHLAIVRELARLLEPRDSDSAATVKRRVRRYLNRLTEEAPRRGRGAATGHFVDHVVKKANSFWSGLFHTYTDPRIPRTTNALEGFFGTSKRAVRRTTGGMSTAGGKLESCGEAVLRVRALMQAIGPMALASELQRVTPQKYAEAKTRLRALQRPARERRSIQRDPHAHLKRLLKAWLDTS